jgi:hypothetical protein
MWKIISGTRHEIEACFHIGSVLFPFYYIIVYFYAMLCEYKEESINVAFCKF